MKVVHTLATFATVREVGEFVNGIIAGDTVFSEWLSRRLITEKTTKPLNEAGHRWRIQFLGREVPDELVKRIEQATGGAE